jgi:RecA/RadA recombinase
MAFVRAERSQLWLRLAIMGPSGSGKTFMALRIAKGIADRIGGLPPAVIDTEGRSASKYANRFIFDTDNLDDPSIDR